MSRIKQIQEEKIEAHKKRMMQEIIADIERDRFDAVFEEGERSGFKRGVTVSFLCLCAMVIFMYASRVR